MDDDFTPLPYQGDGAAQPSQPQPGDDDFTPMGHTGTAPMLSGAATGQPTESLGILPFSRYPNQGWRFDPTAGITGPVVKAVQETGDVAQGLTTPETDPRTVEAGIGMSMVAQPDAIFQRGKPTIPSADQLKTAGNQLRTQAQSLGVHYPVGGVNGMARGWAHTLSPSVTQQEAPRAFRWMSGIQTNPDGVTVPLAELERIRSGLSALTQSNVADERYAAASGVRAIDQLYEYPGWAHPNSGAVGPTQQAAAMLKEARANQAAAFRSDRWSQAAQDAKDASLGPNAPSYSKLLQRKANTFARGLDDPQYPGRVRGGYTEAERQAMLQAGTPSLGQKAIGLANKAIGEGGLMSVAAERALGPVGLAVGPLSKMAGAGLEHLSERGASGAFKNVDDLIRSRSPIGQRAAANAPTQASVPPAIAVRRAIAAQGFGPPPSNRWQSSGPLVPATPRAVAGPQPELYD